MVPPIQRSCVSSSSAKRSTLSTKKKSNKSQFYNEVSGTSKNAARERYRVKSLRNAFNHLQQRLPSVPPNTKLSKLDVLILATTYISHLSRILTEDDLQQENGFQCIDFDLMEMALANVKDIETRTPSWEKSYLHPVKKWPMRSRLYAGVEEENSANNKSLVLFEPRTSWN